MNEFRFLWKMVNGKWVKQGGGITIGAFCITRSGTYKINSKNNNWWGTPDIFEITEQDLENSKNVNGSYGPHGMGIEVM